MFEDFKRDFIDVGKIFKREFIDLGKIFWQAVKETPREMFIDTPKNVLKNSTEVYRKITNREPNQKL